jgi:gliding motility-associated-like protein
MRHILKYGILSLSLFFYSTLLQAQQQEANIWYFGRFLGLDFNSGTAVPLNDGRINTTEGVASISDANGDLLFYTEGTTVWNRLHQVMPNGTGLFGSYTSSQSAVIVPVIGDPARYYVFTVDAESGPRGLTYSVVNMTLDAGKGDIELKNVTLQLNVVEKITAVRHCNNRDVWVLVHGSASDIYYSFLVSPTGISATPVISNTGSVLPGVVPPSTADSTSLGYMKASPDGKKIAAAHWTVNLDVSDFNNATGVVSNSYSLFTAADPRYLVYGVEFSPDSRLIYTTVFYSEPVTTIKRNALIQYDASLGTPAAVRASKQNISINSDPIQVYAALQIAPDGKMYMAKNTYKHIASINNPNVAGGGCNFVTNAVQWTLPSQSSSFGLPTFIQSYFYPPDSFRHTINCPGLSVNFDYTPSPAVISVLWNFGDPVSGANNTSTQYNPVHVFSAPGTYNVEMIKFTNCGPDTLRKQISPSGITINLGNDTLICGGSSILLNTTASGAGITYVWQDGSTNPTFAATTSGLYWVQASNSSGCTHRDSINVSFKPIPVYSFGNDTTICQNDTLTLNATVNGATGYLWNTIANTSTIPVSQPGLYWCEVNKEGCFFRDSINVAVAPRPVVNLGADISVCGNNPVILDATNPNATYLWQNGLTSSTLTATTSGLYWVQVNNTNGCSTRDSITITFNSVPVFSLGNDQSICQGDTLTLNAAVTGSATYLWNNGATTPTIKSFQAGTYWCEVTRQGCVFRDTLIITAVKPSPVVNLGNDRTVCEGIAVALDASYPNATYLWQDGSAVPVYNVTAPGIYSVFVDLNGCSKADTIRITHTLKPRFTLGPDQAVCPGNPLVLAPALNQSWQLTWQNGSAAPAFTVTAPGQYSLTATNNCGSTTDNITIANGICKVFMPGAFTPNNDGLNDLYRALGTETVTKFEMKIFNRWGGIIFQSTDKLKGWNGRLGGTDQPSAVYVYTVQYTDLNSSQPQFLKGTFLLIR